MTLESSREHVSIVRYDHNFESEHRIHTRKGRGMMEGNPSTMVQLMRSGTVSFSHGPVVGSGGAEGGYAEKTG